jgi:transposase
MRELEPKQEIAICALLEGKNKRDAAKEADISEATLYRWLDDADFRNVWRSRQNKVFQYTLGKLRILSEKAAETLEKLLDCGNARIELETAKTLLTFGLKASEIDFIERLERLEKLMDYEQTNSEASWKNTTSK